MTDKTQRPPNYYSDIDKYGKFGEDVFLSKYKNLKITDVRNDKRYQQNDIDFIITKDKNYYVEVKTDTVAQKTGNLAFEVISHGACGWSVVTKADFVYMVLADDDLNYISSFWIDMKKWKEYCSNRKTPKKLNVITSENIVDLLCKIKDLKEYKVIV